MTDVIASAPAMSTHRPLGAAIACALLGVAGLAGLLFGPYLVAIAVLVIAPDVDSQGSIAVVLEVLLGLGAFALGVVALVAARGLWRGHGWAWPVAAAIAIALLVAASVIVLLDRWSPSYLPIVVLGVALLASLAPRSVRAACGIGRTDAVA